MHRYLLFILGIGVPIFVAVGIASALLFTHGAWQLLLFLPLAIALVLAYAADERFGYGERVRVRHRERT